MSGAPGGPPPEPVGPGGASVPSEVEADRDPGLQPERTRLAWRRTTLSCTVAAVLAVRQALRADGGLLLRAIAVGLLILAFVAFLWLAHLRIQRLDAARPPAMPSWAAVSVVGCTVAFAAFGAALVF